MFIWSGLGFLALIIPMLMFWVVRLIAEFLLGDYSYIDTNRWLMLTSVIMSSLLLYFITIRLNKTKGRAVIDKQTGKEFQLKNKHAFFFIDLKYWPLIIIVIGLYYFFK